MCNECWTAAQAIPAAAVVGRFAWVGYRERIGARLDSMRGRGPSADGTVTERSEPLEGASVGGAGPSDGAATTAEAPAPTPVCDERLPDLVG